MSTIFNFKCNNCGTQIEQFVKKTVGSDDSEDDKLKCPNCGSEDCEYQTKL